MTYEEQFTYFISARTRTLDGVQLAHYIPRRWTPEVGLKINGKLMGRRDKLDWMVREQWPYHDEPVIVIDSVAGSKIFHGVKI